MECIKSGDQTNENNEAEDLNQKLGKCFAEATPQHNKQEAHRP